MESSAFQVIIIRVICPCWDANILCTLVLFVSTIFSPVASDTQCVRNNNTRHLSSLLTSGKFSKKHQNSGQNAQYSVLIREKDFHSFEFVNNEQPPEV